MMSVGRIAALQAGWPGAGAGEFLDYVQYHDKVWLARRVMLPGIGIAPSRSKGSTGVPWKLYPSCQGKCGRTSHHSNFGDFLMPKFSANFHAVPRA